MQLNSYVQEDHMVARKLDAPPRIVNSVSPDCPQTAVEVEKFSAPAESIAVTRADRLAPESVSTEMSTPPIVDLSGAAALMRTIQDAAVSQHVDPVKFDRLLNAQDRIARKEAQSAFDKAFAEMQGELPVIEKRGVLTDEFGSPGSSYALWEDINEAVKPVLSKFGFGLRFRTAQDHGAVVVTAIVSHAGGHAEETTMRLPVDMTGGKNAVQAIGSSTSYGKRYAASALLNLTGRDEDDDGKAAAPTPKITAEEVAELRRLIAKAKADEKRLAVYLGVPSLEDIPPSRLNRAREAIQLKGGRS
jgi:hypothetical protein